MADRFIAPHVFVYKLMVVLLYRADPHFKCGFCHKQREDSYCSDDTLI